MTSLPLDSRENYDLCMAGPGSGGVDRKSWVVQRRRAPQSGCSTPIFPLEHRYKKGSTPSSSKYCLVCGIILRNENFYALSRPELLCALNVILQGVQRMCLYLLKKEKVPVAVPLSAYLSLKNLSPAGRKTTLFPGDRMNMPQPPFWSLLQPSSFVPIPLWIQRARFKDSNYKRTQMRESLNLFRNRFYLFKIKLFVHTAGRRLDQRLKRLLAVVSLP